MINMYKLDVKIQDVNRKKGEIKRGERRERDNKAKKIVRQCHVFNSELIFFYSQFSIWTKMMVNREGVYPGKVEFSLCNMIIREVLRSVQNGSYVF